MKQKWIKKDDKRYMFASKKMPYLNSIFGITEAMRKEVDDKLKSQIDYLKENYIDINGDKQISLFDMSMGANIKPNKYFGEMYNRVATLRKYAEQKGFTAPVFMTITPPSHLKPLKQIKLSKNKIKLVDNPRFIGVSDYVNQAREYQSKKWTKFLSQRIFKDIKRDYGDRLIYMRTYEPMIDGTPHTHIVAFIPPEYLNRFVKLAKKYFNQTRFDIKTKFDDNAGGVIAYILKYILKSFSNSKTNKLDDVGYWYAYYQIRRFVTSRTLVPLKIYKLIKSKEDYKDMLKVTNLYKNGELSYELQYNSYKLMFKDYFELDSNDYQISEISVLVDDYDFAKYEVIYKKSNNITVFRIEKTSSKPREIKHIKEEISRVIEIVEKDKFGNVDKIYNVRFVNGELKKVVTIPAYMKNLELYQYYLSLNPDDENLSLHHYAIVKNECIKRGLIDEELQSINNYNTDFPSYSEVNKISKIGS